MSNAPRDTSASARTRPGDPGGVLRTPHGMALVCASAASAAIGFGYAAFYAAPALLSALADGGPVAVEVAHLIAALAFAVAQVVAVLYVFGRRSVFFAWLAPAALYLFAIGLVGWLRTGEGIALWLDSARGLCLLVLGIWHLYALRRGDRTRVE